MTCGCTSPAHHSPEGIHGGVGRQVIHRPTVLKRFLELPEPSLSDQRPDLRRVMDGITDIASSPTRWSCVGCRVSCAVLTSR